MVPIWKPTKPRVSVHQSTLGGWKVEVWVADNLVYSDTWEKRPTPADKRYLIRKYSKKKNQPED